MGELLDTLTAAGRETTATREYIDLGIALKHCDGDGTVMGRCADCPTGDIVCCVGDGPPSERRMYEAADAAITELLTGYCEVVEENRRLREEVKQLHALFNRHGGDTCIDCIGPCHVYFCHGYARLAAPPATKEEDR